MRWNKTKSEKCKRKNFASFSVLFNNIFVLCNVFTTDILAPSSSFFFSSIYIYILLSFHLFFFCLSYSLSSFYHFYFISFGHIRTFSLYTHFYICAIHIHTPCVFVLFHVVFFFFFPFRFQFFVCFSEKKKIFNSFSRFVT